MTDGGRADNMTLRDYFAAETLSAMLVSKDLTDMEHAARAAYAFADAMLRERSRFYKQCPSNLKKLEDAI